MRPCEGLQCKALGICPTEQDLKDRTIKQTDKEGKDVPDHVVLEMNASFSLLDAGDLLDKVLFTELQWEATDKLVRQPSKEGYGKGQLMKGVLTTESGYLPGSWGWWQFPALWQPRSPGGNWGGFKNWGGGSNRGGNYPGDFNHSGGGGYNQSNWGNNLATIPTMEAATTRFPSNSLPHSSLHHHPPTALLQIPQGPAATSTHLGGQNQQPSSQQLQPSTPNYLPTTREGPGRATQPPPPHLRQHLPRPMQATGL